MTRIVTLALAAAACAASPAAAQDLTLDQVLARHYETMGGLDAWKALHSLKMTGTLTMGRGMAAPFTRVVKRPGKVRTEFSVQGMTAVRAYDGATAWHLMPFRGNLEPEVVPAGQERGLIEGADIDGPLIGYAEEGTRLELVGLVETEGTAAYKIKVTRSSGTVEHWFLDADFFLPIMIEATRTFRGNAVQVETILSDYKQVGGLWIAHSEQTRLVGGAGGPGGPGGPGGGESMTIEKVELNVALPDSLFTMPKGEGQP
jgi:hypothetical protein